jgi:hypothetical protein
MTTLTREDLENMVENPWAAARILAVAAGQEFREVPQDELDSYVRALGFIIGKGHTAKQDVTGCIEVLPCGLMFEPCEVETEHRSLVGTVRAKTTGWQANVMRHYAATRTDPPENDYEPVGDPSSTLSGAIWSLGVELASEQLSNGLNAYAEDAAWNGQEGEE